MPPPSSRMTKQPPKPGRYRPGKAEVESQSEPEDDSSSEEEQQPQPKKPAPKATSFPARKKPPPKEPDVDLEGFLTASESSEDEAKPAAQGNSSADQDGDDDGSSSEEEESGSEDESEEEDSSSDDEPKKPLLRPTFISKAKRAQQATPITTTLESQPEEEEERRRKAKTDELLQSQLERDAAAKAAGKKAWDDDADIDPEDQVDDRDGVDPEAEHAAWKLRELKRVRRERLAIEEKEQEIEELERRRNLTASEREAEDRLKIEAQNAEREGKGKMAFMQKYHHKGAFFQGDDGEMDEDVKEALTRDFAGARFEDEAGDKSVLPEYMKMRDMTRLGRKGRTRYKDLKSEDTGSWGELGRKRRVEEGDLDKRFRPDEERGFDGGRERTGANNAPLGERRGGGESEAKRAKYD